MVSDALSAKIIELRKSKSLNQETFADKIGISRRTLSQWETGMRIPSISSILKICEVFDIDPSYFGLTGIFNDTDGEESVSALHSVYSKNYKKVAWKILSLTRMIMILAWSIAALSFAVFFLIAYSIASENANATVYALQVAWEDVLLFSGIILILIALSFISYYVLKLVLFLVAKRKMTK